MRIIINKRSSSFQDLEPFHPIKRYTLAQLDDAIEPIADVNRLSCQSKPRWTFVTKHSSQSSSQPPLPPCLPKQVNNTKRRNKRKSASNISADTGAKRQQLPQPNNALTIYLDAIPLYDDEDGQQQPAIPQPPPLPKPVIKPVKLDANHEVIRDSMVKQEFDNLPDWLQNYICALEARITQQHWLREALKAAPDT
jgi:hypothetical protein